MKFKVGDRIRSVSGKNVGTIVGINSTGAFHYYNVKMDNDNSSTYFITEGDAELAEEKIDHKEHDAVNHPEWYTSDPSGVECIEITKHRDFCVGNAIKYLWRCGLKKDADKSIKEKEIEDLKKAVWYINTKIDMLTNE